MGGFLLMALTASVSAGNVPISWRPDSGVHTNSMPKSGTPSSQPALGANAPRTMPGAIFNLLPEPGAAVPRTMPGTVMLPTSGKLSPQPALGAAAPRTMPGAILNPLPESGAAAPRTLPGATVPRTMPGTTLPRTVPGNDASRTVPDATVQRTMPGTAVPRTMPGTDFNALHPGASSVPPPSRVAHQHIADADLTIPDAGSSGGGTDFRARPADPLRAKTPPPSSPPSGLAHAWDLILHLIALVTSQTIRDETFGVRIDRASMRSQLASNKCPACTVRGPAGALTCIAILAMTYLAVQRLHKYVGLRRLLHRQHWGRA